MEPGKFYFYKLKIWVDHFLFDKMSDLWISTSMNNNKKHRVKFKHLKNDFMKF